MKITPVAEMQQGIIISFYAIFLLSLHEIHPSQTYYK